jgi:hypothetical protein
VVNAFYNPNKNDIGKRGWSVGRAVLYLVSRLV